MASEQQDVCFAVQDHARYGELEELKAVVDAHRETLKGSKEQVEAAMANVINSKDEFAGSTALHKASANGHTECVEYLVEHKAAFIFNNQGASPLLWAVQNKQLDVVKLLLQSFDADIDVLLNPKPQKGAASTTALKNCLNAAFDTGVAEIVEALLAHSSAAVLEKEGQDKDEDIEANAADHGATHVFRFPAPKKKKAKKKKKQGEGEEAVEGEEQAKQTAEPVAAVQEPVVRVRELPMTKGIFADKAEEDKTGLAVWSASVVFSQWLSDKRAKLQGKAVLELGSGCGLPGLTALVTGGTSKIVLTDFFQHTVDNLSHNLELNCTLQAEKGDPESICVDEAELAARKAKATVIRMDWTKPETWPKSKGGAENEKFDVIIGSDLVYSDELVPALCSAIDGLLSPTGVFMYCAPTITSGNRQGGADFIAALTGINLKCTHSGNAAKRYKNNSLAHGDDDEFHTYFNDMAGTEYRLYEFVRVSSEEKAAQEEKKKSANKKKRRGKKKAKQPEQQEEELPF